MPHPCRAAPVSTAMSNFSAPGFSIRPYTASDQEACLAVFRSNLPRYFDPSELPEFEAFLQNPSGDYFVLEIDGSVVACGGCYVLDGTGRLSWGMVARERHHASLGTVLLAWRVNHLLQQSAVSEIGIDTSQHTEGFFARHGFSTTRHLTNGLAQGIDLVSMSLQRKNWRGWGHRAQRSPTPESE